MMKVARYYYLPVFGILHAALGATAGPWSGSAEVRHEDSLCVSYQARLDGPYLVVHAVLGPGWHTFAMDNKRRADEKLAGRPALSIDRQTEIATSNGLVLDLVGPWAQSPPIDFSRPQLRWFSWGFDKEAFFVAKVRRRGPGPARIVIRGQTCRGESICKEINVTLSLRLPAMVNDTSTEIDVKGLVPVR